MNPLARYLSAAEITQEAFAGLTGVTQATVSRWVNGVSFPSRDQMRKIQEATSGVVMAQHWYGEDAA